MHYRKRQKNHPANVAIKYDDNKSRVDLIPSDALIEIGHVLAIGAKKYGANNWRSGMKWSRLYASCLRHLYSWKKNDTFDTESGRNHLAHAACCILFLINYSISNSGIDDR